MRLLRGLYGPHSPIPSCSFFNSGNGIPGHMQGSVGGLSPFCGLNPNSCSYKHPCSNVFHQHRGHSLLQQDLSPDAVFPSHTERPEWTPSEKWAQASHHSVLKSLFPSVPDFSPKPLGQEGSKFIPLILHGFLQLSLPWELGILFYFGAFHSAEVLNSESCTC